MKIVVVGAGVVGQALAQQLSQEGHQVSIVDSDRLLIRDLGEKYDVLGVVGNGAMPSVLRRAGIEGADMLIAVTNVDEVNLVVGMLAHQYQVEHRVVRLRNREYVAEDCPLSLAELGVQHIINPEPAIVEDIVRMVEIPGCNEYHPIGDGQVLMVGFTVDSDSPTVGRSLAELREASELNAFLILYITRGEEVVVPRGDQVIEDGDRLHMLASKDTVPFILPIIHRHPRAIEHVIIAGATRVGVELAQRLVKRVKRVMLIEADPELAQDAASRLPKVVVLNGSATDVDVLEEAGIETCDLFCAMSDEDQRNMLATLLAKKHGARQAAVMVHHPDYVPVLDSLGMETVINPRLVTVSEILTHVRRGNIHSVTRLHESAAEIIELEATENSKAVGHPLKSIKFPKNALVGAILRNGDMQIATGGTVIDPGDHVVVYALPDAIPRIEKLFARR